MRSSYLVVRGESAHVNGMVSMGLHWGSKKVHPRTDLETAYQVAVDLWTYEGNLIWAKFNALLVANGLYLPTYILAQSIANVSRFLLILLPVAGLVVCGAWFLLTKRGFETYVYWVLSARELEKRLPSSPTNVIQRGGAFADGEVVSIEVDHRRRSLRLSPTSRTLTAARIAYAIIGVFAVVYVALVILALLGVSAGVTNHSPVPQPNPSESGSFGGGGAVRP